MRPAILCILFIFAPAAAFVADQKSGTLTSNQLFGFFADAACTRERVEAGNVTPNNPECAKRCVKEGSPLGFVDERAKTFTVVSNPDHVKDDIGYRVEIAAHTTADKKLEVRSVKHLSQINAMCARKPIKQQ